MPLCSYQPSLKSIPSLLSYFLLPHSLSSVLPFTIVAPLFFSSPIYFYSIKIKEKYEKKSQKKDHVRGFLFQPFVTVFHVYSPTLSSKSPIFLPYPSQLIIVFIIHSLHEFSTISMFLNPSI